MGEDVTDSGETSDGGKLTGHLSHISWNDRAEELARMHGLPSVDPLEDLIEELDGLALRDQGLPSGEAATNQRRQVAKAARKIKREAEKIIRAADNLRSALSEFSAAVTVERDDGSRRWSASMLHQVFDIPPVSPTAMDLPQELAPLGALEIPKRQWLKSCRVISDLAALPVRNRIRPGSVPDPVRVRAVLACRSFWEGLGRSWTRGNLADGLFRDEATGARREGLKGPAVEFVRDALTAAEIHFTLSELNSAWVDAEGHPSVQEKGPG